MALHRLLLWFLGVGAVVFVGAAGATVYQVLSPGHAGVAMDVAAGPLPDATPAAPVVTAVAEPQPVVPAAAPTAPPPSAPQAAAPGRAPQAGRPAARRPAGSVVAARHPIHPPARVAVVMVRRPVPTYPAPRAVAYAYPGYAAYAGYPAYGYYRPYVLYRGY
jgi:hypothetical protein